MLARTRFVGRYGHALLAMVVGIIAWIGFDKGDAVFPLLSAALLVAIALSVHATERMAFSESMDDWRRAELREVELHQEMARLTPQVSEV